MSGCGAILQSLMRVTRRPAIAIFILLGICLVGLIVTLNVTWIILNWRRLLLLWLGIPVFLLVIAGVVVNTVFLVRGGAAQRTSDQLPQYRDA